MSPTANTIYFICGNQKAGKNTLVHYLMESDLIFEID
jgi:polynucleotide 5'-kinase involved in rRNA processing